MTRDIGRTRMVGMQMLAASWIIDSLDGRPLYYWLAVICGAVFMICGAVEEFRND